MIHLSRQLDVIFAFLLETQEDLVAVFVLWVWMVVSGEINLLSYYLVEHVFEFIQTVLRFLLSIELSCLFVNEIVELFLVKFDQFFNLHFDFFDSLFVRFGQDSDILVDFRVGESKTEVGTKQFTFIYKLELDK